MTATAMQRWPISREVLRHQTLMDEMMAECVVDVLELIRRDRGRSFAEARARCRFCLSAKTCRQWLLSLNKALASPPAFCPNAELFRACQRTESPLKH
jgi:hypothetical protein